MNSITQAFLWCILQVTLLTGVGSMLYLLARRIEPRLGRLAVLTMLCLVTLLTLTAFSPWPNWQRFNAADASQPEASTKRVEQHAGQITPVENASADSSSSPQEATSSVFLSGAFWTAMWDELNRAGPSSEAGASLEQEAELRPTQIILAICGACCLLGAIRLAAACFAIARWRRKSTLTSEALLQQTLSRQMKAMQLTGLIETRETPHINTAATIGWRRPVILLPTNWRSWSRAELEATLAHELAHISAWDWPAWLLAQTALTLHFYHPLVHWLARRLRLEQELAADATAAAVTGSQENYLNTLAGQMLRADRAQLTWAAQTFLPTRSTIVRRIEMLRKKSPKLLTARPRGGPRLAVVATLSALGLVLVGFRGPGADDWSTLRAEDQQTPSQSESAQHDFETPFEFPEDWSYESADGIQPHLRLIDTPAANAKDGLELVWMEWEKGLMPKGQASVPGDSSIVEATAPFYLRFKPREMLASDELADVRKRIDQILAENESFVTGLEVSELETVVVAPYRDAQGSHQERYLIRFTKPLSETAVANEWSQLKPVESSDNYKIVTKDGEPAGSAALYLESAKAVLFDSSYDSLLASLKKRQRYPNARPAWLQPDKLESGDPQAFFALNMEVLRKEVRDQRMANLTNVALVRPLIEKPSYFTAWGKISPNLVLDARAICMTDDAAEQVSETAKALRTLALNMIDQQRGNIPTSQPEQRAMIESTMNIFELVLKNARLSAQDEIAMAEVEAGSSADPLIEAAILLPAIQSARQAARRTQSINNLKQLALAMLVYESEHGHFPPPVLTGPDGKTKYSWRVAVLPYLEQKAMYDSYHRTEPWDSEHNKNILQSMPAVFRSPTEPADSTKTSYFVLVGEETAFPANGDGTKIVDIRDGTSNTLMLVDAKRDIPWTKPEDIPYSASHPLPKMGGYFEGLFLAACVDGSVRALKQDIDGKLLRSLLTRRGGEQIVWPANN